MSSVINPVGVGQPSPGRCRPGQELRGAAVAVSADQRAAAQPRRQLSHLQPGGSTASTPAPGSTSHPFVTPTIKDRQLSAWTLRRRAVWASR